MNTNQEINEYINKHVEITHESPFVFKCTHHDKTYNTTQTMRIQAHNYQHAKQILFKKYKHFLNIRNNGTPT